MKRIFNFILRLICLSVLISSCTKGENVTNNTKEAQILENPETSHIVSIDEAEKELLSILNDMESFSAPNTKASKQRKIASRYSTGSPVTTKTQEEIEPYVHIFNFEDNGGFAIMSGDDRVTPLLALTLEGELKQDVEVDNPGLGLFLANVERHYEDRVVDHEPPSGYGVSVVYGPWRTVNYLMRNGHCKVQWGQWEPYNKYCPIENDTLTLTGCVATAVAQLMSVYEYPTRYEGYYFDWSKMNQYKPDESAKNQIARLMQQLGLKKNLDMDYGIKDSGANPKKIPRTLKNFGFSNGGNLIDYTTTAVVDELKNGYYVLIGGFETRQLHKTKFLGLTLSKNYRYFGGHRWLVHGLMQRVRTVSTYNSDNNVLISQTEERAWYPLCNFGWNGGKDGYYLSGAFDTKKGPAEYWSPYELSNYSNEIHDNEGTPNNFQYKLTAIVGIRK